MIPHASVRDLGKQGFEPRLEGGAPLRRVGRVSLELPLPQHIDQLREPECFGGWLRSMAQRMAINRAMRRQPLVTGEAEALDASAVERHTPLDRAIAGERKRQVRAGLKRLKAMDRDTLVAFYVQGRSLVEMSDQFESPVGTIKRRLHVARKRLAKELAGMAS